MELLPVPLLPTLKMMVPDEDEKLEPDDLLPLLLDEDDELEKAEIVKPVSPLLPEAENPGPLDDDGA